MIDTVILSNFANIRLTSKQFRTLKKLYRKTKDGKAETTSPAATKEGFYKPLKLGSAGIVECVGVVPEYILLLKSLGFIDLMDPKKDPNKDDQQTKSFIITPAGVMFFIYYRGRRRLSYFPVILSLLSLLVSVTSVLVTL